MKHTQHIIKMHPKEKYKKQDTTTIYNNTNNYPQLTLNNYYKYEEGI